MFEHWNSIYLGLGIAAIGAVVGGGIYYWRKRRRRARLVSFVAFSRTHRSFDSAVIAGIVNQLFQVDVGDGTSEGPDGMVISNEILTTILLRDQAILINSFPTTYVQDVESAANSMPDLRMRKLFLDHQAWFSCDHLGVTIGTPESEVFKIYGMLAKIFVRLLDDDSLVIHLPDFQMSFPINEDTERALMADNPIGSLMATAEIPVIEIDPDHPSMKRAVEMARRQLPTFLKAVEENSGDLFSVKAPITVDGTTEFIWIQVTCIEGERVFGTLANAPNNLGALKLGSRVSIPIEDINDWLFVDRQGKPVGGFSMTAIKAASKRR